MTMGMNCRFTIWRMAQEPDDEIGGAIFSGTPVYQRVRGRLESVKPTQLLLEQGLEWSRLWDVAIRPYSLDVQEGDLLELTYPRNHKFYGEYFRVSSMDFAGMHPTDGRSFLQMRTRHVDFGRSRQ